MRLERGTEGLKRKLGNRFACLQTSRLSVPASLDLTFSLLELNPHALRTKSRAPQCDV